MDFRLTGMAVTIKDVARAAGVSASTVTRALSNPEMVNPATRDRVRQTAAALGYQPNRAARGLITGRTGNLGLLVPDLANPFFPSIVKGVQARAHEADYAVFLVDTDEDATAEAGLVSKLSKQVDGLILCSPRMSEEELRTILGETPVVLLNRRVGRVPSVTPAFTDAMRQAVSHLTALGHRRIAYVAGPRTSWANRERVRSLRAVAASSADFELVEIGNVIPQFPGGVAAADQVLAADVTAVIAYNDLVALGRHQRARLRRHRPGRDGPPVPDHRRPPQGAGRPRLGRPAAATAGTAGPHRSGPARAAGPAHGPRLDRPGAGVSTTPEPEHRAPEHLNTRTSEHHRQR